VGLRELAALRPFLSDANAPGREGS
jgi:hypothetical protein